MPRMKNKGLFGKKPSFAMPSMQPEMPMGGGMNDLQTIMHSPQERQAAQQPMPVNDPKAGLGTRLFGQGWEDKAFALGGIMQGDPSGVYMMREREQAEQKARAEAAAAERERAMDLADWKWKEDYKAENAGPAAPNLREDNAGNVWQFDPKTGMPMGDKPVWIDPTEKVIYQDGMQIRVPNPYRSGGARSASVAPGTVDGGYRFKGGDPADQNNWEPVTGGASSNASGGFQR